MLKTRIDLYEENGRPTIILIKEYDDRGETESVTRIEGYSAVVVREAVEAFVSGRSASLAEPSAVIQKEREKFKVQRPIRVEDLSDADLIELAKRF